jgi:membrane-associated protease RseP (regulator of RpoE activity)
VRVQPREEHETVEELESGPWGVLLLVAGVAAVGYLWGLATVLIVLFILLCIFLHELGHYMTARSAGMKVTEFFIGFGPRIWSFHRGETEYGFKAIPAGAYVKIIGMSNLEDDIDPAEEDRTYRAKPYWRRLSVALAGSTMHFLIALVLAFVILAGFGERDPSQWTIGAVTADSPAMAAGLELGDDIMSVDGQTFSDFTEMSEYLRARPGEEVELVVARDGQEVTIEATLAEQNPSGQEVGFLGVGPDFPRQRVDPVTAIGRSFGDVGSTMKESVTGLGRFFSPSGIDGYVDTLQGNSGTAEGEVDEGRITSIVGAVNITSQVAENDLVDALLILMLLNVFIGVFNLVPLLPLDGGHVAVATYEKIREMLSGRTYRADVGKLLPLTYAVFLVLVVVGVTALWVDIVDPVKLPG